MLRDYWWLRRGFLLSAAGVIALSLLVLWGGHAWGVANDCQPNQIDGQCGMATGFGDLFGQLGAFLVFAVGLFGCIRHWRLKA
jgi:hypothetical protein